MKIVKCENCKHMYNCEYTYMGGCSNGETWSVKTPATKKELIEKMKFDIGPTMTVQHNGKDEQVIFYSKESLAKVLIARGWVKHEKNS